MIKAAGTLALVVVVGSGFLVYGLYVSAKDAVAARYYCSRWFSMKQQGRP